MIDPQSRKPFNKVSALKYILGRTHLVDRFLDERVREEDKDFVLKELLEDPVFLAKIIKLNYEMKEKDKINKVINEVSKEGNLTIMLGAKGYGKTATTIWLIEEIHKRFPDKNLYWFGYNPALKKAYPFVNQTISLTKAKENSVIFIDETTLYLGSRDAMSRESRERIKALPTMRHRGCAMLFITQAGQAIDVQLFMFCDMLWFKPYFVWEFDERMKIKPQLKYIMPYQKSENLVYFLNDMSTYIFRNPLPRKWNDELSKPFSILTKKEAREYADMLFEAGFSEREVKIMLEVRGVKYDEI